MITVSQAVRDLIDEGRVPEFQAVITYAGGTSETVTSERFLSGSPVIRKGVSASGVFTIGGAVISSFSFSLMNDDGHFDSADFAGAQIVPQVSYDSETWYSLGTFFFASHKSAGGVIICTAYDALALMDEAEFSSWPCTFLQAAQAVCTAHGLTLAATSFDGASMSFTDPGVTMTERMTLSYMAQCTGNHVRINAAGELVIEKVTGDTKAVSSVFEANLQTAVINYTGVRITPYGSDSSTLFGSEGNVLAVSDNPLITTSNVATIGQTLQTYLGAVNIAAYSPGDADILSDFTLEPGDVLTFDDPRGVSHDFMVTNLIYKLGVRESVSCDAEDPASNDLRPGMYAGAVKEAKSYTDSVEIGGRNLLLETGTERTVTLTNADSDYYIGYFSESEWGKAKTNGNTSDLMCVSFDWETTSSTGVAWIQIASYIVTNIVSAGGHKQGYKARINLADGSGHYWAAFRLSTDQAAAAAQRMRLRIAGSNTAHTAGSTFTLRNLKFELGNKPTAWIEAPEDLINDLASSSGTTVINGGHITTGTIDASLATITNINASNISSGTLNVDRLAANSIKASKIDLDDLFAQNVTARGTISGGTIIGAKFEGSAEDSYLNVWLDIIGEKLVPFPRVPDPYGIYHDGDYAARLVFDQSENYWEYASSGRNIYSRFRLAPYGYAYLETNNCSVVLNGGPGTVSIQGNAVNISGPLSVSGVISGDSNLILGDSSTTGALYTRLVTSARSVELFNYEASGNVGLYDRGNTTWIIRSSGGQASGETLGDVFIPHPLNVGGRLSAPNIVSGTVTITPTAADTPTGKTVTWSNMGGTPYVVATARTTAPGTVVKAVSFYDASATGCTIYVTRSNTTNTPVNYIAIY